MLVAIGRAFDLEAIDRLLFLGQIERDFLLVSGDGLLHFSRLVTAGLASVELKAHNNWMLASYAVNISDKGNRVRLKNVLSGPIPAAKSGGLPT